MVLNKAETYDNLGKDGENVFYIRAYCFEDNENLFKMPLYNKEMSDPSCFGKDELFDDQQSVLESLGSDCVTNRYLFGIGIEDGKCVFRQTTEALGFD